MNSGELRLEQVQAALRRFSAERNWAQFHTPKNLASALSVEAAELLEIFQWMKTGEIDELGTTGRAAAVEELADVFNYLVMLADVLKVDLLSAAQAKIQKNALKYPVDTSFGNAKRILE